jgi:hypothetical protein
MLLMWGAEPLQGQVGYGSDVAANILVPTGKFSSYYNLGFGGWAGMFYDTEPSIRVTLSGGLSWLPISNEGVNEEYRARGGTGTVDAQGSLLTIPLLLGVRLMTQGPDLRVYGLIEGGLYLYRVKLSGTITDQTGSAPLPETSEFRAELGLNGGIGVLVPMKDNLSLDICARYHLIRDSEYSSSSSSGSNVVVGTSQLLSLTVGVNFYFSSPGAGK